MAAYRLTVRRRGATERRRFGTLAEAVDALDSALDALAPGERRTTEHALARELAPVAQVAMRAEIAGPRGVRGGVDLRGDGSAEAFTGRVRRHVVERVPGETAPEALRRALGG
jgi:hypothetical protein